MIPLQGATDPALLETEFAVLIGLVIVGIIYAAVRLRSPIALIASSIPLLAILPAILEETDLLLFFVTLPIVVIIFGLDAMR